MVQQQVLDALREKVRNELQGRILEMIDMSGRGRTDKDILNFIEIATKNGFSAEREVLERIVYELGEAQIKKVIAPKSKRGQPEKQLEDYLEKNGLEGIEAGLKFKARQIDLHSGTIDVDAADAAGRAVTTELKARDYDSANVFFQIMKYAGEQKDRRFIFAAPEVKPDLFFSLQETLGKERIAFYRVLDANGEYSFERVDESSFGEVPDRKINFDRKKSEGEGSIISVVRGGKRFGIRLSRKPNKNEERSSSEGAEEITPATFHKVVGKEEFNSLPRYMQILSVMSQKCGENLRVKPFESLEEFLSNENIAPTKEKIGQLEGLLIPKYMKLAFETLVGENERYSARQESVSIDSTLPILRLKLDVSPNDLRMITEAEQTAEEYIEELRLEATNYVKSLSEASIGESDGGDEKTLMELRRAQKKMEATIKKAMSDRKLIRTKQILNPHLNSLPSGAEKSALAAMLFRMSYGQQQLFSKWAKLKIERFEQLKEVNAPLAFSYLFYTPGVYKFIDIMKRTGDRDVAKEEIERMVADGARYDDFSYISEDGYLFADIFGLLKNVHERRGAGESKPASGQKKEQMGLLDGKPVVVETVEFSFTRNQLGELRGLIHIPEFETALDKARAFLSGNLECLAVSDKNYTAALVEEELFVKRSEALNGQRSEISNIISRAHDTMADSSIHLEERISRTHKYVQEAGSAMSAYRSSNNYQFVHRAMERTVKSNSTGDSYREKLTRELAVTELLLQNLAYQYNNVRLRRIKKLFEFNPSIAEVYIGWRPELGCLKKDFETQVKYPEFKDYTETLDKFYEWFKLDSMFYEEFVNGAAAALTDSGVKEKSSSVRSIPNNISNQDSQKSGSAAQNPLISAISFNGLEVSREVRARVAYFAEDSASMATDYLTRLSESFSAFKLDKKFRHRESLPSDIKIRNFFDDITLQYVSKGKVPTKEQLERVYDKA